MPDAPDTQAATAVADPPAASPPESTAAAADRPQVGSASSFDAIFAQALAGIPKDDPTDTSALSGETRPTDPAAATAKDAKSTSEPPAERVSASETPGEGQSGTEAAETVEAASRRKQIGTDKDAEIARLSALVAERDSDTYKQTLRDQARAELEAETARKATEAVDEDYLGNQERFEALKAQSYLDLSQEDRAWLDEREDRRRVHAPVERHIRSIYDQRLAADRAADEAKVDGRINHVMDTVGQQIQAMAELPGVDYSDWKTPGRTFADYGRALYAGGAAHKEAELNDRVQKAEQETARVKKDNEDLRLQVMGATPAPLAAGRSASGAPSRPQADPSGSWQDNLGAAFGWDSTTH